MNSLKLIQRIQDASKALQRAYDNDDVELAEELEDELFELEEMLEEEEEIEYENRHQHGWN